MRSSQLKTGPGVPVPVSSPSPANKTPATVEGGGKTDRFCRPLATQFRHDGFDYRQITREGDAAIFAQSRNGRVRAFEVIRIRRHDGFEIAGRLVEPAEYYPRSGEWGAYGWTLPDLNSATAKQMEIAQ